MPESTAAMQRPHCVLLSRKHGGARLTLGSRLLYLTDCVGFSWAQTTGFGNSHACDTVAELHAFLETRPSPVQPFY